MCRAEIVGSAKAFVWLFKSRLLKSAQPDSWNTGVCEAHVPTTDRGRGLNRPTRGGEKGALSLLGEISARPALFAAPSRRDGNLKMSGVLPTDKCKAEFAILREKRAYKFITFKIDATGTMTDVCDVCPTSVRSNNARDGRERRAYP